MGRFVVDDEGVYTHDNNKKNEVRGLSSMHVVVSPRSARKFKD